MVASDEPYALVLTSDFEEDLYLAAHYVEHVLAMPQAARRLMSCVEEKLRNQCLMPECAASYRTRHGDTNYTVWCGRFAIHYTIEGRCVKALGLKHSLQR
ncbi:hypothetical protein [Arabiibacter massiliensis]|uniref:hypothetical protein n=1 Tax=Arabiibacter massiliensis TaxID=1870985 RepID=UPI0009B955BC|nr:hypothetical protein [Arabiibacter massiliensis]